MFIYTSLFRDEQLPTRRTTDFFSLCFLDTMSNLLFDQLMTTHHNLTDQHHNLMEPTSE